MGTSPTPHQLSWESITTPGPFPYKTGKCQFGQKNTGQTTKSNCAKNVSKAGVTAEWLLGDDIYGQR